MTIQRYLRAFVRAFMLTLRGETAPPPRHSALHAWTRGTVKLLDQIDAQADRAGIDRLRREQMRLKVDGREIAFEAALRTIRHHAAVEYPYLLKHYNRYSLLTLQATNLNDRYLAQRFATWEDTPPALRAALAALERHLQDAPIVEERTE